jgi:hypothetical protein
LKLLERILSRPVEKLTRAACILALLGLLALCVSVLFPRPLPVIFAMSGGHVIGILAFACYLLAIVIDARKTEVAAAATSHVADSAADANASSNDDRI